MTSEVKPDFVEKTIEKCQENKGLAAKLKRADNPATEHYAWEYFGHWGIDLENPNILLPYAYIAAAIARAKPEKNGSLGIGEAIAKSYDDGKESDPAKAKLRRLLACENKKEACQVLRPLLSLIASRGVNPDYASLLNDLIYFNQQTKRKWAKSFYGHQQAEENNNE